MSMKVFSAAFLCATGFSVLAGCASEDSVDPSEDNLTHRADSEWFYSGPLSKLENPSITASIKGHTAHVSGYLPAGTTLPTLPHVHTKTAADGRLRVDVVYPIATSAKGNNSKNGTYSFYEAKPFRPDGSAYTASAGVHFVTWGGFPFLAYNQGIAFHGPITTTDNKADGALSVWYLRRGQVSAGCNRMNGEHVVELAHIIGISMRKTYGANKSYVPATTSKVIVTNDYDSIDGKLVDVDYPTDVGAKRPEGNVEMFGSWMGSETPDGSDLAPDMKWEGGVAGKPYVLSEHVKQGWICSFPKGDLAKLTALAAKFPNSELPQTLCAKKSCIQSAFAAGKDAKVACSM